MVEGGESPFRLNGTDMDIPEASEERTPTRVRLITIPKFHETGELVLLDSETLEVEVVKFELFRGHEEMK